MTSPRLEEYARRAKLPITVRVAAEWRSLDGEDYTPTVWRVSMPDGDMDSYTTEEATRAYLQAVKELTE